MGNILRLNKGGYFKVKCFRICFTNTEGISDLDTLVVNEEDYQFCLDVVKRILGWNNETEVKNV